MSLDTKDYTTVMTAPVENTAYYWGRTLRNLVRLCLYIIILYNLALQIRQLHLMTSHLWITKYTHLAFETFTFEGRLENLYPLDSEIFDDPGAV